MSRKEEEYTIRLKKAAAARKQGIDPYPGRVERSHTLIQLRARFDDLEKTQSPVQIVGRLMTIRAHGGSTFATIDDGSSTFQIYLKRDTIGESMYQQFSDIFDAGDFVGVTGTLFRTKKNEMTVLVTVCTLLTKTLLPLPEKWHGLSDIEIRYRQRYLDLLSNPAVRSIFIKRAKLIETIRNVVTANGFMEVDTPMLQPLAGGATARPFITHHNALDADLYLRVAPELYLKRLLVGGFEKVFEIARCFRNEGIDRDHNPEFTQIELYAAYWDYKKMMQFTEEIFEAVVMALHDTLKIHTHDFDIDFTPPFARLTFRDAILQYARIDIDAMDKPTLFQSARSFGLDIPTHASKAKILDELFKETVRKNIVDPTFIMDYPIELSPLAKKIPTQERYVERFQLVAGHRELCNAFTELNDPVDQRARFEEQEKMRADGDDEAQRIDEDFIEALAHGMPPTAGIGIGIDRLAALLTDSQNLKEVILFPTLKPKQSDYEN